LNGYAYQPLLNRQWPVGVLDGLVIDARKIAGFRNDDNGLELKGTTVVHELGHWLGLYQ
jgi:hypothetical protein